MRFLSFFFALTLGNNALAQQATESWIRIASAACGGGQALEVEGEVEAGLLNRLRVIDGGLSGEGKYTFNDIENILSQFESGEKASVYTSYTECLRLLMSGAAKAAGEQPSDVVLDSGLSPAGLDIVPLNSRFAISENTVLGMGNQDVLMITDKVSDDGEIRIRLRSTKSGSSNVWRLEQGEGLSFENCVYTLYNIDIENRTASFISVCER